MIKINLLQGMQGGGDAGFDSVGNSPDEQKTALVKFLAILILPTVLYFYERGEISKKKKSLQRETVVLNNLITENEKQKDLLQEIERLQEEKKKLEAQASVIEDLSKGRLKAIKGLDAIQNILPKQAWLTSLQVGGSKVTLVGRAVSDDYVSNIMSRLQQSIFFSKVSLMSSIEKKTDKGIVKEFEITCQLGESV